MSADDEQWREYEGRLREQRRLGVEWYRQVYAAIVRRYSEPKVCDRSTPPPRNTSPV